MLAALGFLGLSFIRVVLLGGSLWWLFIFLIVFIAGAYMFFRSKEGFIAPLGLAMVILFVLSQGILLSRAGLVSLSSLQDLAGTVNRQLMSGEIVAVGSHDIHEKELQIYFNDPVLKAATSESAETLDRLNELFQSPRTVYCLFTEDDYNAFLKNSGQRLQVLKEDFIFRRRIYPDRGLFEAFFRFDRPVIQRYFLEKIILVVRRAPLGLAHR